MAQAAIKGSGLAVGEWGRACRMEVAQAVTTMPERAGEVEPAPVGWDDEVDQIIGGDLTAVLGYVTPASGVVISPVAPLGLRNRAAGTISFTTSLGFGRKLERFAHNPKMSLAFAAREHGFATSPRYVLVQGSVVEVRRPDTAWVEQNLTPRAERFLGPVKRGRLWDRGCANTTRSGSS